MTTLGHLRTLRERVLFVGRADEGAVLDASFAEDPARPRVFYVHGPGGVGKTALVRAFVDRAAARGFAARWLDARDLDGSPDGVVRALAARDDAGLDAWCASLATPDAPRLVVIDTYERARGVDRWLREALLPRLPASVVVVVATRDPPSEGWRTDPLWPTVIRPIAVANLDATDAHAYLARRGVGEAQRAAAIEFTRGQPLALSLVADVCLQRPDAAFAPDEHPDVVHALVEQFAREAPDPRFRRALEACAIVRSCNEAVLAAMLDEPDVHELFTWLRGLSFVQLGAFGVLPHDLARDALVRELRWRDPELFARFIERAHAYYEVCIADRGRANWRHTADHVYLHRFSPVLAPVLEWNESSGLSVQAATAHDVPALLAMVERHEGSESAALTAHWLARQPAGALVLRDDRDDAAGFVLAVTLTRATAADIERDPCTRVLAAWLAGCGPIRRGDSVVVFRAWMARDSHQAPSPAQNLALLAILHRQLTTPNLALSFLVCRDPDAFAEVMRYSLACRTPDVDFAVGANRYGLYHYDFRHLSPSAFLSQMARRAAGGAGPDEAVAGDEVDHDAFVAAVREALVDFGGTHPLGDGPLARSRLVAKEISLSGAEPRAAIENVLRDAALALRKTPRGARQLRVLEQTYFGGRIPQERAAELVDLPFSTYRRYLAAGVSAVAELLWGRELATRK